VAGQICVPEYERETLSVSVTDSLGNSATETIPIRPALRFSVYLISFVRGSCTLLSASGGVPHPGSPAYDFFWIREGEEALPLEDQMFCPTELGPVTLEVRDHAGNSRQLEMQVYAPLRIVNERLHMGCQLLSVEGGKAFDSFPYFSVSRVLPDGNLEQLADGQFCGTQLLETVTLQVDDASGQSVRKSLIVYTAPPKPILLMNIDGFDLHEGECTSFSLEGNRGLTLRSIDDSTGGYQPGGNYDPMPTDEYYEGQYCAGSGVGPISLTFSDDDNQAEDAVFVLTLNGLGPY
jgi:hypothetical protein